MRRVEQAAARADRELAVLDTSTLTMSPVLTPVLVAAAAGIAAGAVVGYVHQARHGTCAEAVAPCYHNGDIRAMSIDELLQTRQDAMAG